MKTRSIFGMEMMLGLLILAGASHAAPRDSDTNRVEIPVRALLTPEHGFEEKNDVQVVLYGALPNACYTLGESVVEKQPDGKSILVRQFAIHDATGVCAEETAMPEHMQMLVPFTAEVSVGQLAAGNYQFIYALDTGTSGVRSLTVSKNVTPTVDSLPYAATSAAIAPDVVNGKDDVKVKIAGVLNSTCTSLDDNVRIMTENDVFVLLPTIKVKTGVMCAQVLIPFEKEVNLGKTSPGIHLVHVRSMNGKSVNKVVIVAK